jgi:hypothetical protein
MRKNYKNLLVGGCSFSSDGIGGTPPTALSPGGCSFVKDEFYEASCPNAWPGFLAQQLGVVSMINTASASHGNILIANSILECLNRFEYNPTETLVVMNISDPSRYDVPCSFDHPDSDRYHIPWTQELIPYSYFDINSNIIKNMKKQIGYEQIEQLTSNSVEFLFNFLKYHSIDFYFLTMGNYNNSCLTTVLTKFDSNYIKLTPGPDMIKYCQQTNTARSNLDNHPNNVGHRKISDIVFKYINEQ